MPDESYRVLNARGNTCHELARPWIDDALEKVMREDAAAGVTVFESFEVIVASEQDDLEFATDYNAELTSRRRATVAFRGRGTDRSARHRRPIRQMTLRQRGAKGRREYDKVLGLDEQGRRTRPGKADFYVTAWCSGPTVEAAILVDLARMRAFPPDHLMRLEHTAMSTVPFVGYDAAALIAHNFVRAAYPDLEYFAAFTAGPDPDQGTLAV